MSSQFGWSVRFQRFLSPLVCMAICIGCQQQAATVAKQEPAAHVDETPISDQAAKRVAVQQKRDAQEKLLLLEKEQVTADIERITGCIKQDQNWLREWREKLAKFEADWKAQRMSMFDFHREQRLLDDDIEKATARVDRDLARCKDLRKRIDEIDSQLKKLYEEILAE